jgi:misacylated tRNA(Ala) deacylase
MPTDCLFRDDSYLRRCDATVVGVTDHGLVLDRTVFYANSGGQPGDRGVITTEAGHELAVETAVFTDPAKSEIAHVLPAGVVPLAPGERVGAAIDWDTRYRRMRMHTALHLLSAALPFPVTGGSVGESDGRLDFDIPAQARRHDRSRRRGDDALDQRRRARRQPVFGQDHVGQAPDGHRTRAPGRDRRL